MEDPTPQGGAPPGSPYEASSNPNYPPANGYSQVPPAGGYAQTPGGYAHSPGGYAQTPPVSGYGQAPPPGYNQIPPPGGYAQPPYAPPATPVALTDAGLTDTAAGALAYVTILPAILFLVIAPYNTRPFVKFHSFQCLGLAAVWICLSIIGIIPILGLLVLAFGSLAMLILWIICIVKASQGSYLKLPYISDFAAKQSGYLAAGL